MTILNYETLAQFKQARFGSNILTFDDLVKERNFTYQNKEYHMWVARKDKKEYLIKNEDAQRLPLKVTKEEIINDGNNIWHFVKKSSHVGFSPHRHYSFRQLVDALAEPQHSNRQHQKLSWLIALASQLQRVNVRKCSNIEFGKDSTYVTLAYLTNQVGVFNKPRTMAKLEYGLMFRTLMVNELVPNKEEERHSMNDFLLNIGGLSPSYAKTSRVSAGTKENYDISKFSLVVCYNTLQEISERDKQNYFDFVFGSNVLSRFMPFKFSGKLSQEQFRNSAAYTEDVDKELLKIARTIEWYKQNFKQEIKPFGLNLKALNLGSERQETTFMRIAEIISLYADTEAEWQEFVKVLLECYYSYHRMVHGNNRLVDFNKPKIEVLPKGLETEIIDLSEANGSLTPLQFIEQKGGEVSIDEFLDNYDEKQLSLLLRNGEAFKPKVDVVKLL